MCGCLCMEKCACAVAHAWLKSAHAHVQVEVYTSPGSFLFKIDWKFDILKHEKDECK